MPCVCVQFQAETVERAESISTLSLHMLCIDLNILELVTIRRDFKVSSVPNKLVFCTERALVSACYRQMNFWNNLAH